MREETMSGREHLSEDRLLDVMYGAGSQDAEQHLRSCPDCAGRVSEWKQRRASATGTGELSSEFLAAQRREIYQRLSAAPSRKRLWAPVLAAACALAVGVFLYQPNSTSGPVVAIEANDTQLFMDVFSMEQSVEPSATASVRVLFEEQQ
jgi:anti-sigma factor RsiW